MEKLKENQEEILNVLEQEEKDTEAFKKDLEEFVSYWEKEAEDLKNRELTEDNSRKVHLNFDLSKTKLNFYLDGYLHSDPISRRSADRKIDLIESKINNSLAIARSNFRSKHRTILERIVDSIGGIFHIFDKGH